MMALYRAMGEHEVQVLLSMIPERDDSYMYHVPNIELTEYVALASNIPLETRYSAGKPPQENLDLKHALEQLMSSHAIEGVCVGAVRSNYQYGIVADICSELDLGVYAPFWQKSHESLIAEALDAGFEIIIVGVAAEGLTQEWLGRRLDSECLLDLKNLEERYGVDVGGEGGEYETLVLDAPFYSKRIEVVDSFRRWDKVRGDLLIEQVRLVDKK
jgi:ABC transporter with metal-binding/Fe-S-binding domain ATP-binding protein